VCCCCCCCSSSLTAKLAHSCGELQINPLQDWQAFTASTGNSRFHLAGQSKGGICLASLHQIHPLQQLWTRVDKGAAVCMALKESSARGGGAQAASTVTPTTSSKESQQHGVPRVP
jgi:hypothetical protein